ncbi:MAG: cytochrome c [Longimicrobiales bacterium]
MVDVTVKKTLMTVLVAAFVVQTVLVYSDERQDPLSADAMAGRELWHANACQVCHQIYGQGGPLGPDLTNAASRVDDARLGLLLKEGSGQMPALGFTDEQVAQMAAYLEALDRPDLGRGQLRLGTPSEAGGPWGRFADVMDSAVRAVPSDVADGFAIFQERSCTGCHWPLRTSAVGAPDLSLTTLSEEEIRGVLINGMPGTIMVAPTPPLGEEERASVIGFIRFLRERRDRLAAVLDAPGQRAVDWSAIPWWNYR